MRLKKLFVDKIIVVVKMILLIYVHLISNINYTLINPFNQRAQKDVQDCKFYLLNLGLCALLF